MIYHRRKLVAFGAVETLIGRDEVPQQIVGYKCVRYKVLNSIVANGQFLLCINAIDPAIVMDHQVPEILALLR